MLPDRLPDAVPLPPLSQRGFERGGGHLQATEAT